MTGKDLPSVLLSGVVLGQPMGGVRRHNAELLPRVARLLESRGGRLAILEGTQPIPFEIPSSVERISSSVPPGPPLARALQEGHALRSVIEAARAKGKPFDLVHTAHLPAPSDLPLPYTLTLHDLRHLEMAKRPISRRIFARSVIEKAVLAASGVIAVSDAVACKISKNFGPCAVAVVPNAGDHLEVLPRKPDDFLLYVGHLEQRKNIEVLLRAIARDPRLPDLELVGAPKEDEDERLAALARSLGVADRVHFRGPVDDATLSNFYAKAACVLLPSRVEGFGIPVLEAQLARAPLVIADIEPLREVAGSDVPHFATDDPQACAMAIRKALETDEPTLERWARHAERFRWQDSAERLVEVWAKVALSVEHAG